MKTVLATISLDFVEFVHQPHRLLAIFADQRGCDWVDRLVGRPHEQAKISVTPP
ncbi:MAG: hypothetical protein U0984_06680 [Prosthecobacter sp.]|nr:hypothetical protein [Prosthecobacter sp.]